MPGCHILDNSRQQHRRARQLAHPTSSLLLLVSLLAPCPSTAGLAKCMLARNPLSVRDLLTVKAITTERSWSWDSTCRGTQQTEA